MCLCVCLRSDERVGKLVATVTARDNDYDSQLFFSFTNNIFAYRSGVEVLTGYDVSSLCFMRTVTFACLFISIHCYGRRPEC